MAEKKKHATAIRVLMDTITDNSNELLRARNQLHEAERMMERGEMTNAAAIMMVNAKDSLEQRQSVEDELWRSMEILVADRKASE